MRNASIQKTFIPTNPLITTRYPLHKVILPHESAHDFEEEVTSEKKYLIVNLKNQLVKILAEDVVQIKADGTYSMIFLKNGQTVFTSKTLKYWQERLSEYAFWRCHASYLINPEFIESYQKKEKTFNMTNNWVAHVSRRYAKKVVSEFTMSSI